MGPQSTVGSHHQDRISGSIVMAAEQNNYSPAPVLHISTTWEPASSSVASGRNIHRSAEIYACIFETKNLQMNTP